MLDKITFVNGTAVSSSYLKEVQKASEFSGSSRANFYSASDSDHNSWAISQRDGLKDYEISNPRDEQETAIGRLAHDGVILGYESLSSEWTISDATFTEPKTIPISLGESNSISVVTTGAAGNPRGVLVEAGKIVLSNGEIFSWNRQIIGLVGGDPDPTVKNYVYVKEDSSLPDGATLAISSNLPNPTSNAYVPLAELDIVAGEFRKDSNNSVVGTGVIDLRPNLFVGALNNYSTGTLKNTSVIHTSAQVNSWDRAITDTSNGSVIISLPGAEVDPNNTSLPIASDNDRVAIVDLEGSFDRYPVVLRPGYNTKVSGSTDDWIINIKDAHIELFYNSSTAEWRFEESPGSECTPKLGSFLSCGGKEFIGERLASECPDGAAIPAEYPNPSEGVYRYEASTSKCYKEIKTETAIYSNGEGGLIKIFGAGRCRKNLVIDPAAAYKNTIFVDAAIGSDELSNSGTTQERPFRTPERAILEAVRRSRVVDGIDSYDNIVIEIAPGDYYIDNSPGVNAVSVSTSATENYIRQVTTGYSCLNSYSSTTPYVTVDVGGVSSIPPVTLNLGRSLYTSSGSVGTISKIEKEFVSSTRWKVYLKYVNGTFEQGDELLYNRLSDFNPTTGGIIVPRGISINGIDLRKVRIRPMYVPELTPGQNVAQDKKTYIWKVTGGTYVSLMTFADNPQIPRTHNTVTSIGFASQAEIKGGVNESSYYSKVTSLFAGIDGWAGDGLLEVPGETTIVAPIVPGKENRSSDLEQNQTGKQSPDLEPGSTDPAVYPGPTLLKVDEGGSINYFKLPDVNSTRSSSPYIFNCSVRSIFGLQGLWADGRRVSGFKSMVTANFTQVSLQTDPNCFENPNTEYFSDPPVNKNSGVGKKYRSCLSDPFKYRHVGFRGSADSTIQLVSCFVIGNADHFISDSGADLSITNSCSDFGDISLRSLGYKEKAFSQDEKSPQLNFSGTRITKIIPPLPLSTDTLANGASPTLVLNTVSTGLKFDYEETKNYIVDNKSGGNAPQILRVYVRSSNSSSPFSLANPPSAKSIGFGQFTYTKKNPDGTYYLSGGEQRQERKTLYISGFDDLGNSVVYTGVIQIQDPSEEKFSLLDDSSKIFGWDSQKELWYINVSTSSIIDETEDLDGDGFLTKKLDSAFKYLLNSVDEPLDTVQFVFDGVPIQIRRATDRRTSDERVYRVVLEGFLKNEGLRTPQSYYVLEKQQGVSGFPLNEGDDLADDPLTVTAVRDYYTYTNPGEEFSETNPDNLNPHPGKYITYLTTSSDARDVFTADFLPQLDLDEPEATEDPDNSPTKVALNKFNNRPGVYIPTESIQPGTQLIEIKETSSSVDSGILISLRRPSVIRASGHTWEWTGYLNYDTSFPIYQGDPLEQDFKLGKIIVEETGGRVYASGMNEEGNFYIGTNVYDLKSGEQFAIPLKDDTELGNVSNQVLSNVIIKDLLFMNSGSELRFGPSTKIVFSTSTELGSESGDLSVNNVGNSKIYSNEERAGFVQLASKSDVRGASGEFNKGNSEKVAVSAARLAEELDARFDGTIQSGSGPVNVTSQQVDLPGAQPGDSQVTQFTVNIGLPASAAPGSFSGIKLGSTNSNEATSIVTQVLNPDISSSAVNDALAEKQLVTAKALRDYIVDTDQINAEAVGTNQLANLAVTTGKIADGAVGTNQLANLSVSTGKIIDGAVIASKLSISSIDSSGNIAIDAVGNSQISSGSVDTDELADESVNTNKIANGAVTASKLNGGQSGSAPVYGIRHFGVCPKAGGACAGSGSLSAGANTNGEQTITFTSNAPGNTNYTVIVTSTDVEGDHAVSVDQVSASSFRVHQSDIEGGGNSNSSEDEAGCMVMVIY
jgi:hypothetical protein